MRFLSLSFGALLGALLGSVHAISHRRDISYCSSFDLSLQKAHLFDPETLQCNFGHNATARVNEGKGAQVCEVAWGPSTRYGCECVGEHTAKEGNQQQNGHIRSVGYVLFSVAIAFAIASVLSPKVVFKEGSDSPSSLIQKRFMLQIGFSAVAVVVLATALITIGYGAMRSESSYFVGCYDRDHYFGKAARRQLVGFSSLGPLGELDGLA